MSAHSSLPMKVWVVCLLAFCSVVLWDHAANVAFAAPRLGPLYWLKALGVSLSEWFEWLGEKTSDFIARAWDNLVWFLKALKLDELFFRAFAFIRAVWDIVMSWVYYIGGLFHFEWIKAGRTTVSEWVAHHWNSTKPEGETKEDSTSIFVVLLFLLVPWAMFMVSFRAVEYTRDPVPPAGYAEKPKAVAEAEPRRTRKQ